MRTYIERAMDFIAEVYPFIKDFESPWTTRRNIREYNAVKTRNVIVKNGCARIALITSDYVVKWDYDEDEVEEVGGCENEVSLYSIAELEGFAYLFAQITRFEYKGRYFYIMPRVRGIRESNGRAWQYMTNTERLWCESHNLTDLHCNNYGLTKGKITIVDYGFVQAGVKEYTTSESSSSPSTSELSRWWENVQKVSEG